MKHGSSVKDVKNNAVKPITIIKPKSITGLMSLKIRDAKATIVVNAVYKQGHIIFFVVSNID